MAGVRGKVNLNDLKKFKEAMEKMGGRQRQKWNEAAVKELAARLIAKAVKRTPAGRYGKWAEVTAKRNSKNHQKGDVYKKWMPAKGKGGGTLKRGWVSKTHEEAESGSGMPSADDVARHAGSLAVTKSGDTYTIDVVNPVEYAPYVEFGHRTANHQGWVDGRFMLTMSELELQKDAPGILTAKLEAFMGGALK